MPGTPAKKALIIEKLVENTTPRSRQLLSQSPSVQAVINLKVTRKKLSTQFSIIESLKQKLGNRKEKQKSTSIVASKILGKARNNSAVASMLNVSRKILSRCAKNADKERKPRKDKLPEAEIDNISNFYLEDASREMPNKRDVLLLKDKNGQKLPIQKQIMEMTQNEAYEKFKAKNPGVKIGQRKFDSLRPQQVRKSKLANRIVCCCTYCENVRLKLQTLNKIIKDQPSVSTTNIVDSTLCDKVGLHHPHKCIQRQCDNCGTNQLREKYVDILQTEGNREVTWKEGQKKKVPLDADRFVSRVVLISNVGTFNEFFNKLESALAPHAEHLFRASWQYEQFRENVSTIKEGELVMAMDFSENYTCRYGREIQSFHWNQKQITIHPMMLYYMKHGELQKEGFTTITDDLKHDSFAVSEFEKVAVQHLRDNGTEVHTIHQWTDGCAAQYKCRHSFSDISQAESKINAKLTRNYFETSHGKGPCDGLGGIIKRKVSNAIIQDDNRIVSNASELTQFCEENLRTVGGTSSKSRANRYAASSRNFKYIPMIDRTSTTSAKTVPGCRKLHSVKSTGVNHQLEVRSLSCYCVGCRINGECENSSYVNQWNKRILTPVDDKRNNENPQPTCVPVPEPELPENETAPQIPHEDPGDAKISPKLNDFVAIKFVSKISKVCFFAKVCEVEHNDVRVEYLEKCGKNHQYPEATDESWQKLSDIVCLLQTPDVVVTGSRVKCVFQINEKQNQLLKEFKLK